MNEIKNQSDLRDEETYNEINDRRKLIWIISGIVAVLLIVILFFAMNGDSNYERGDKYLKQKQYSEALVEFQNVETDDKDFRMAQSKINYINGLRAFNDGLKPEAKSYLLRVDPKDEYYNEAVLMIDKINLATKESDLQKLSDALKNNKDTVIIREKIADTSGQKISEAGTVSKSDDKSKIYILNLEKLVKDFESHYLIARNTKTSSKEEYVVMDSLYNKFTELDNPGSAPENVELKDLSNTYMQKRIEYIQKRLGDNSATATETAELKYLREDGDKIYNKVMRQINQMN
ncbi:MAG: hypothetical protein M3R36_03120 [Bacteroidota bacterium]|nr:hypothetical protein [Bacteroidota bacterium]